MVELLRPARGGFLRPFGCAWFIRAFLLGNAPMGSRKIDPDVGDPQVDIHRFYKAALFRAYAEDMVALEEEEQIRKKLPPLTIEKAEERTRYYLERIPSKFTKMRYPSFTKYFSHLKRLGYVEKTGRKESDCDRAFRPYYESLQIPEGEKECQAEALLCSWKEELIYFQMIGALY